MKSFVIAIKDNKKSLEIAQRCIETAMNVSDLDVSIYYAITPKDNIYDIIEKNSININCFDERYSRKENAISCFLSHFYLWKKCLDLNEKIIIFEHDAVIKTKIDTNLNFNRLLSIGKPSYGKYNIPKNIGVNKLTSKQYLPGAHAYIITPEGARELIERSKIEAKPVDVFIHMNTFPWLQELYPWPVVVEDTFTTVQKVEGCIAKHSYKNGFEII